MTKHKINDNVALITDDSGKYNPENLEVRVGKELFDWKNAPKEALLEVVESGKIQELKDIVEAESTFEEELDDYESDENKELNVAENKANEPETAKYAAITPPETSVKSDSNSAPLLEMIDSYVGNDVLEIFGETGTGKSQFVLEVAREALAAGKKVYYLDTERNLTKKDVACLKGCQYKYTPDMDEIDRLAQCLPKVDVVIIDSIGFPVLTTFARMPLKQKGDALLKLIAIFGDLKKWAYKNDGVVLVTNQPESDFNKDKGHVIRPFADKSQFAAKEIWKTEFVSRRPDSTKTKINAFRSRSVGHGTRIADMEINNSGVHIK